MEAFKRQLWYRKPGMKIKVTIDYDGKRLSITGDGWEANSYGRLVESFGGQCVDELAAEFPAAAELVRLWDEWHLNDMRAGCEHQRALGWRRYDDHPSEPCPTCGYKYGTAWLYEAIPPVVLARLQTADFGAEAVAA